MSNTHEGYTDSQLLDALRRGQSYLSSPDLFAEVFARILERLKKMEDRPNNGQEG